MRESIQLHEIRCERCVNRLAAELAPIKGLLDARVEMGTSSLIVEYADEVREHVDAAIKKAGFQVLDRFELPASSAAVEATSASAPA